MYLYIFYWYLKIFSVGKPQPDPSMIPALTTPLRVVLGFMPYMAVVNRDKSSRSNKKYVLNAKIDQREVSEKGGDQKNTAMVFQTRPYALCCAPLCVRCSICFQLFPWWRAVP
jgi:hypothetical protein